MAAFRCTNNLSGPYLVHIKDINRPYGLLISLVHIRGRRVDGLISGPHLHFAGYAKSRRDAVTWRLSKRAFAETARVTIDILSSNPNQCIGMQPFSNSSELLTLSCSSKNFTIISQTVQELSCWETNTHTNQTLLKITHLATLRLHG